MAVVSFALPYITIEIFRQPHRIMVNHSYDLKIIRISRKTREHLVISFRGVPANSDAEEYLDTVLSSARFLANPE